MSNIAQHKPVLTSEVIEYLNPQPGGTYVDVTFGGGGHTRAILDFEPTCRVLALDWDKQSLEQHASAIQEEYKDRLTIVWANFAHLHRVLKNEKIKQIDGVLADLGTSQYQIFEKKGFSFLVDTPLDMRMSPAHQRLTAADVVNHYSLQRLVQVFSDYGEEPMSKMLARTIIAQRKQKKIKTTKELADLISSVKKTYKSKKKHPATQVFQALRIEVNHEMENIHHFLMAALKHLKPGGNLVCISFHSLEDRMVKNFYKMHDSELEITTPKPIKASDQEVEKNPSSRSAKLRVAKKKNY